MLTRLGPRGLVPAVENHHHALEQPCIGVGTIKQHGDLCAIFRNRLSRQQHGVLVRIGARATMWNEALVPPCPQRAIQPFHGFLVGGHHDAPFTFEAFLDEGRYGGVNRALLDVVEPPLRRHPGSILVVVGDQPVEDAHAPAGRPGRLQRIVVARLPRRARDIKVSPRTAIVHEALEKLRRRD